MISVRCKRDSVWFQFRNKTLVLIGQRIPRFRFCTYQLLWPAKKHIKMVLASSSLWPSFAGNIMLPEMSPLSLIPTSAGWPRGFS